MKILLLITLLSISTVFAQDPQYSLLDVGQGFVNAVATDVNNQGQVVGYGIFNNELGSEIAFFWESGNTTLIAPGTAVAINDSGWVLMVSSNTDSLYLWKNGSTINLNPFPVNSDLFFEAKIGIALLDVNNQNNVVANFLETVTTDTVLAHIWQNGAWSRLVQPVGFENNIATSINDNNDISGFYWNFSENIIRPLYWQYNQPLTFSFEGYATSLTEDIRLIGGFGEPNDLFGGWKWENFSLDTIFTTSPATKINEAGSITGLEGYLYKDGNAYPIESILDSTGNGYTFFTLLDINDLDQIVGLAYFGGTSRAILLNPVWLEVTSPKSGQTWIAGEQDTIRWISSLIDEIEIELSIDDGNTYETLELSYPAASGEYVWSIPDTLLSRKCIIRINANSLPGVYSESNLFKIKGYYLTRVTSSGDYEKFVPNEDGWQFGNNATSMWPPQWWQQFNYTGIDPITNKPYGFQFIGINNFTFPDWQLWVETFGINQCYRNTGLGLYRANSVKRWKAFSKTWGGSCYGFAASSFLGFNYKAEFLNKHPGISNYTNLFDLAVSDSVRKAINHYYIHQKGQIPLQNDAVSISKKPLTTLAEVRQMFLSEDRDIKSISLLFKGVGGGGHTVVPYEITKDNSGTGRYRIYVYDSNNPGSDSSYILIDSTFNWWGDRLVPTLNWVGWNRLYLEPPISNYLSQPVLPGGDMPISNKAGDPLYEFYISYKSKYLFTTASGDSIGFLGDSVVFNLNEGVPIVPKTGMPHPPIGQYIPLNEYFIYMNDFTDSSAYLTVFGDVTYDYQRRDATNNQTDRFYYNGNFSVSSEDAETKSIELSTVIERDSTEKTIFLENTSISQSDSLDMSIQDYDKLTYKNYGSAKSYDLRSTYAMPGAGAFFFHMDVSLAANTSHQIVPDWADLANTPVTIYVDSGIDGTIDDTLMLKNQITNVEDQGNLILPKEYKLEQNYPNPFNPTTKIKYSIPTNDFVSIKVYNLVGEEVATLVNEEKSIGNYEVDFNAAALSSGVYFYRIQAGSFIETKKMILLK